MLVIETEPPYDLSQWYPFPESSAHALPRLSAGVMVHIWAEWASEGVEEWSDKYHGVYHQLTNTDDLKAKTKPRQNTHYKVFINPN